MMQVSVLVAMAATMVLSQLVISLPIAVVVDSRFRLKALTRYGLKFNLAWSFDAAACWRCAVCAASRFIEHGDDLIAKRYLTFSADDLLTVYARFHPFWTGSGLINARPEPPFPEVRHVRQPRFADIYCRDLPSAR